ncbi:MAG: hypothetical protein NTV54_01220, partial [Ignavibacteriales bacterium]|nr:hypothetical protein [Ignavibacteriales bacterium]
FRTGADFLGFLQMLFTDESKRTEAGLIARRFVLNHCGATDRFLKYIEPLLVKTPDAKQRSRS